MKSTTVQLEKLEEIINQNCMTKENNEKNY